MRRLILLLACILAAAVCAGETVTVVPAEIYSVRKARAFAVFDTDPAAAETQLRALLKENPDDPDVLFQLGRLVMRRGHQLKDGAKRKKTMKEAREIYAHAQQAGSKEPLVATALAEIKPDGSEQKASYSDNQKVNELIHAAETAFQKRDFPKAIARYRDALALDPAHYAATLYLGDAYFAKGDYTDAITWFGRAIEIDPNRETAYRYRGDALARIGRKDDAFAQHIEAVVTDPYNAYTWRALQSGWQANGITPHEPARGVATATLTRDKAGKIEMGVPGDVTMFDLAYGTARSKWQEEHPLADGAVYRQSLDEEASALRVVLEVWRAVPEADRKEQGIAPRVPALTELAAIEAAGLLEAHILLFRANQDLSADYPAYRETHRAQVRELLRRFFLQLK